MHVQFNFMVYRGITYYYINYETDVESTFYKKCQNEEERHDVKSSWN